SSSATSSTQRLEQPQPFACCGTAEASSLSFLSSPVHRLLELADSIQGACCLISNNRLASRWDECVHEKLLAVGRDVVSVILALRKTQLEQRVGEACLDA